MNRVPRFFQPCKICGVDIEYTKSQGVPVTCGKICKSKNLSRMNSGSGNPCFGLTGSLSPMYGTQRSHPGWHHTEETKANLSKKWVERTNNGTYLVNLKFKQDKYTSSKTGRVEHFHSSYEKERMIFLDNNVKVLDWTKQHGVIIQYMFDGKLHNYIPDFFVSMRNGDSIIEEIKGFDKDPLKTSAKTAAAISFCEDRGWKFSLLKKKDLSKERSQRVIFMEGPDNCGKSHLAKYLSHLLTIPYFRWNKQHEMFLKNEFKTSLEYIEPFLASFIKQVSCDVLFDRCYASEFTYSNVFARETNQRVLDVVDKMFAEMGAIFVVLLRKDYSKNGDDVLIPDTKLPDIHDEYLKFIDWTRCSCVVLYVDDFQNDLILEGNAVVNALHEIKNSSLAKRVIICQSTEVKNTR